jgi:hypothetical protein
VDLVTQVGKVASGLAAVPQSGGNVQVVSASTTGLSSLIIQATTAATTLFQKLVLQQWWLRPQHATCAVPPCP